MVEANKSVKRYRAITTTLTAIKKEPAYFQCKAVQLRGEVMSCHEDQEYKSTTITILQKPLSERRPPEVLVIGLRNGQSRPVDAHQRVNICGKVVIGMQQISKESVAILSRNPDIGLENFRIEIARR